MRRRPAQERGYVGERDFDTPTAGPGRCRQPERLPRCSPPPVPTPCPTSTDLTESTTKEEPLTFGCPAPGSSLAGQVSRSRAS